MKIKIIKSYRNAHQACGLTVVIDVLRAFTTVCFVFNNGAKTVIPVASVDEAMKLLKDNPHFISIGERNGLKLPEFSYGNSPAEIEGVNFKDKTVIFTTSAGTQGIVNAVNAEILITAAFVNVQAVINYIKKKQPQTLSFVITDDRYKDNEDFMCARYIISHLRGKPLKIEAIKKHLINHPVAERFLIKPMTEYSKKDFYLSFDLDRFNFIITAKKKKSQFYLEKLES